MSASVATPMIGLPNYDFSPENMPDFTATDFPDHMEVDRSADSENNNYAQHSDESPNTQRRDSAHVGSKERSSEEEQAALGNLLGALMPNQSDQGGDLSNFSMTKDESFALQEQPVLDEQFQSDGAANYAPSRLPSFDLSAANEIFSNEDFSHITQPMEIPYTLDGQNFQDIDMSHFRQNSFASQGSVARRPATPQQREFEAFARLQFEDGSYYLNTYSCELGRDVLAYRAALQKEREEKEAELNTKGKSRSSSGKMSHRSGRMQRQMGSQIQGSVVSEQGGFAGIDEAPMRPPKNPEKPSMSSQESESSVVKPAEYLINPRTMPSFDYHRSTEMQAKWAAQEENDGEGPDDEQPAAVTAAHLPNPHMCPLIPIHGKTKDGQTDAELHKKISRRHVRIQWSFERDCWEMKVQGRNGAFCDEKFVRWKGVVPLHDGAIIQIAHVVLTFRLPKTAQQQQEAQKHQAEIDADEALPSVESRPSESVAGEERRESVTEQKPMPKISLKINQKAEPAPPELPLGPDGFPPIVKRRGPGRPPKDGIMSTRERKEREKAAKLFALRKANGGITPPPAMRGKIPQKSPPVVEEIKVEAKPEKRKYTKRKATDENGNPIPDIDGEGDEGEGGASEGEPKTKKARAQREKSESPEYPPRESLTAEQLARPPESYAQLLYKILMDLYPRALPLKDIYRELKKRYPWYVYEATTEGWQSSVRHNLNSEFGKYFAKGDKEGKGFAWKAIPNAQLPQAEKKRTTQATAQRARPPPQRSQFQPLPGQNIQWQGTGAFPTNGSQQPFVNHGPWPQQNQPNGAWQQNGTPPAGVQPGSVPPAASTLVQPRPPSQTPQPVGPQPQSQSQPTQAQNGGVAPPAPSASAPSSSSAASNMPCTLDGMLAIKRFEQEMYRQIGVEDGPAEKKEFWQAIFASAKKRVLHGYPESTRPQGEIKAELTIMSHMQNFVEKFANPNFKGFTPRAAQVNAAEQTPPETQTKPANLAPATNVESNSPSSSAVVNNPVSSTTADNPTLPVSDPAVEVVDAHASTSIPESAPSIAQKSTSEAVAELRNDDSTMVAERQA